MTANINKNQDYLIKSAIFASELARSVGDEISKKATFEVTKKGSIDLVTECDLWAEKQIKLALEEAYPEHLLVGEESINQVLKDRGCSLSEYINENICWIVDPIDGTTNFVNKIPYYSVSIGLVDKGERVMGVVYDPSRDELFMATKGGGAYLNGEKIQVSQKSELIDCVLVTGFPYNRAETWRLFRDSFERVLLSCRDLRRFGSAAIDQCWIACGRLDGYFEYNLKAWDLAAGSLIVEEAGGKIGNVNASKFNLVAESYIAAPNAIYPLLETLLR